MKTSPALVNSASHKAMIAKMPLAPSNILVTDEEMGTKANGEKANGRKTSATKEELEKDIVVLEKQLDEFTKSQKAEAEAAAAVANKAGDESQGRKEKEKDNKDDDKDNKGRRFYNDLCFQTQI